MIGEIIVELVGQAAVESGLDAGGNRIYRRWGAKGCVFTVVGIVAVIGLFIWLLIR